MRSQKNLFFFLLLCLSYLSKSQNLDSSFNASNPLPLYPGISSVLSSDPYLYPLPKKGGMTVAKNGDILSVKYYNNPIRLNSNGITLGNPINDSQVTRIVKLPNGTIAALKDHRPPPSFTFGFYIMYFDSTGTSVDSTFLGVPPEVANTTRFDSYEIVAQSDNSVLVSSHHNGFPVPPTPYPAEDRIYKIGANRLIDSSFGTNGYIIYNSGLAATNKYYYPSNYKTLPFSVDLMGRIYVGILNANSKKSVLRYFGSGLPDTTYNTNSSNHNVGNSDEPVKVVPDYSGRIYIVGIDGTVLKLDINGLPDANFGSNGQIQDLMIGNLELFEAFVEADNKLIYIGNKQNSIWGKKVNENGSYANWNLDYKHICSPSSVNHTIPQAAFMQEDGKILVQYLRLASIMCYQLDSRFIARFNNSPCNNGNMPASLAMPTSSTATICPGNQSSIQLSGQLNNASYWTYSTNFDTIQHIFYGNNLQVAPSQTTTFYFKGKGGCVVDGLTDSITLLVNSSSSTINTSICSGANYNFNGNNLSSAGTYYDTMLNAAGCDSIITLNLSVLANSNTSINASICSGTNYNFNGNNLSSAGTYYDTLLNAAGCDSIITLNLSVVANSNTTINASICSGTNYNFNGNNLSSAGTYYDTLLNAAGCDSIITLNLSVYPLPLINLNVHDTTICLGGPLLVIADSTFSSYSWLLNNNLISSSDTLLIDTSGTYILTVTDSLGCVNTDTVSINYFPAQQPNLVLDQQSLIVQNASSFLSFQWYKDGMPVLNSNNDSLQINQNGTYIIAATDSAGCISLDTLLVNTLAISDNPAHSFKLYPNPTQQTLTIKYYLNKPVNSKIIIVDVQGRSVFQTIKSAQAGYNKVTIACDLLDLSPGTYYIQLTADSYRKFSKFEYFR